MESISRSDSNTVFSHKELVNIVMAADTAQRTLHGGHWAFVSATNEGKMMIEKWRNVLGRLQ